MMCRLRDLNYESLVKLDLTFTRYKVNSKYGTSELHSTKEIPKIQLADIPVMVKSIWCRLSEADEE